MRMRTPLVLVAWALAPLLAVADVKPHALCGDGMVLQQKGKVNVWGTADAGEKVTVKFRGQEQSATAGEDGRWLVTLDAGAAGGPLPMTIAGKNTLEYKNVLVGEVWVCSGQSNMEWSVGISSKEEEQKAKETPANPMLRMFTVKKNVAQAPVNDVTGSWQEAGPDTVGGFSAVGYFFGRDLQKSLNVPVGLIHTSWGGTRAEAWTSKGVLETFNLYDDKNKNSPNQCSVLYNGMIHPILKYAIKGAIWYQGESNAGEAYKYRTLFPLMIEDWRVHWKEGAFPFLFVQLAPFTAVAKEPGESNWAELREAQTMTLKLPHTGMAVITDFGNVQDIHPTPKQPVGERLSLAARAQTYGEKVEDSGPMYKGLKVEGNKAVLNFDHTGGGLLSKELAETTIMNRQGKPQTAYRVKPDSEGAPLVGFAVCGEDRKFHNAKAEIVGDTVVVTCEAVDKPVAVRYGWAQHPVCNLYNKAGLPASPFRTDDFPGVTQPKK
jgi:sialate O-acetylesterase